MHSVVLKMILAPTLVGAASMVGRIFGPRAAGLAAALPIVAGPILFFYAMEQGNAFAASAANGTLLGLLPLSAFCVVYALLAGSLLKLRRAVGMPLCLAGGWCVFLAVAAALSFAKPSAVACLIVGALSLAGGLAVLPRLSGDAHTAVRHHPAVELALRMLAAACLVLALTGLAGRLGPAWSGLLAPFPVASSVVIAGGHLADGPGSLRPLLKGFLQGLFGFVAFLSVISFGLERLGVASTFALGVLASLAIQSVVVMSHRPDKTEPSVPFEDLEV